MNVHGKGTDAVPADAHFAVATKLRFPYTNNMLEYEVCIISLKAALDMSVRT